MKQDRRQSECPTLEIASHPRNVNFKSFFIFLFVFWDCVYHWSRPSQLDWTAWPPGGPPVSVSSSAGWWSAPSHTLISRSGDWGLCAWRIFTGWAISAAQALIYLIAWLLLCFVSLLWLLRLLSPSQIPQRQIQMGNKYSIYKYLCVQAKKLPTLNKGLVAHTPRRVIRTRTRLWPSLVTLEDKGHRASEKRSLALWLMALQQEETKVCTCAEPWERANESCSQPITGQSQDTNRPTLNQSGKHPFYTENC